MKSNLDSLFKTNTDLEKEGVWFEVTESTAFLIRRFGGGNSQKVKLAMAKHYKPKARLIEMGQLSVDDTALVMAKVFAEACLIDWKGVEIDGQETPCTFDNAVKLFTKLPELFAALQDHASGLESFKEELGNS